MVTASEAVTDHTKIVNANVGELRAACYLADRPDAGRCGLNLDLGHTAIDEKLYARDIARLVGSQE